MGKTIQCETCGTAVRNVSLEASWVICWECLAEDMAKKYPPKSQKKATEGFPKGWRFMKEFVHSDGTVYYKGVVMMIDTCSWH